MQYEIKQDEKFKFIEEGEGEPLILLHGLFGALSNFMVYLSISGTTTKWWCPCCLCLNWISCIPL